MKVTDYTKRAVARLRERRDMEAKGWEYVGEGGGLLWQLYRGHRTHCRIVEAKPTIDGLGIWVRIEPREVTT